jgi:hypothetical protein
VGLARDLGAHHQAWVPTTCQITLDIKSISTKSYNKREKKEKKLELGFGSFLDSSPSLSSCRSRQATLSAENNSTKATLRTKQKKQKNRPITITELLSKFWWWPQSKIKELEPKFRFLNFVDSHVGEAFVSWSLESLSFVHLPLPHANKSAQS